MDDYEYVDRSPASLLRMFSRELEDAADAIEERDRLRAELAALQKRYDELLTVAMRSASDMSALTFKAAIAGVFTAPSAETLK
jgi:hypothetical protein